MRNASLEIQPIAGALGAEIGGVDLAEDLCDQMISEIRQALLDHCVIFFRDQDLDVDRHKAFVRRFGEIFIHPNFRGTQADPEVVNVVRNPGDARIVGEKWHHDTTMVEEPPMGAVFYAIEVPEYGGDTLFANQYLAFETLSRGLQSTLRGLTGVHSARDAYSPKMQKVHDLFAGMTVHTSDDANRVQLHPAVRVNPETGREALYVNQQYTVGLHEWWPTEDRVLLDFLFAHATQDSFTCRWRWAVGDVAFWDNRVVQHMAMGDVSGHRRAMHRTTVAGEVPVATTT